MRRITALFLTTVLLLAAAPSRGEDPTPAAFLAEARAAHLDLTAKGLGSFSARMTLRRSEDESLRRYKELAGFGYSWTAPETEAFDFETTHQSLKKPLGDVMRGTWRDITGVLWFDLLAKADDLGITRVEGRTIVAGTLETIGAFRAFFDANGTLDDIEFVKLNARITYFYDDRPGGMRVACREVSVGDSRVLRLTWEVFRKTNGFELPTVFELETDKNTTEYAIAYKTVNGVEAVTAEPDEAEVKERVAEFEKGWRGWEELEKLRGMRSLAELSHDLTATAIAKKGLRDRSVDVRKQASETLGILKRSCVVPALIAAMKKNEDEIEVYLPVIRALGEIGDPRAVDVLSKDWWNQRIGEYGVAAAREKIHALGNIRHVTAVDALIDTFFMTKDETVSQFEADLVLALRKLTGKDFGVDRRAWKDWWKKNRSTHEFE